MHGHPSKPISTTPLVLIQLIPDQDYWDSAADDIIAFFSAAVGLSHSLRQRCCKVSVQVLTSQPTTITHERHTSFH